MTESVWPECGHKREPYGDTCLRCAVAQQVAQEQGVPVAAVLAGIDRAMAAMAEAKAGRTPHELEQSATLAREAVERRRDGVLPPEVVPLGEAFSVPCRWFANRESFAPVTLEFDDRGVWCHDPKSRVRLLHRRWYQIADIDIQTWDAVRDRVTVLRAASFGLVRPRRWDAPEHCFVVLRAVNHQEFFFEVADDSAAVREQLAPVTDWFTRHASLLQEF